NGDFVARMQDLLLHAHAVDLDAVGTVQVANLPVAVLKAQLRVQPGDVGKPHGNVARLAPPDAEVLAKQRNGVAAALGGQLAIRLETHGNLAGKGKRRKKI